MSIKKVFIGNDHAGKDLKELIISYLKDNYSDIEVINLGTDSYESCDYPDYAKSVSLKVLENEDSIGVLICGTGIGMSIAANKIPGIRAALCYNSTAAKFARLHNNANVLCLGQRMIGIELAKDIIDTFIKTEFEKGRHLQRVNKIEYINKNDTQNIDLKNLEEKSSEKSFKNLC
ncbi:MAG: ribose 5-phosphate isomerase B [bacterium]|nr:ribose 5-phosphate isomerase B [bacterium]